MRLGLAAAENLGNHWGGTTHHWGQGQLSSLFQAPLLWDVNILYVYASQRVRDHLGNGFPFSIIFFNPVW